MSSIEDYAFQAIVAVASHPISHAKVLMQLGYEPNPKILRHTVVSYLGFSSKSWCYPSIFAYWGSMRSDIGWSGLFLTGLPARLCSITLLRISNEQVLKKAEKYLKPEKEDDQTVQELFVEVGARCGARTVALVVAYPLNVIFVRQVAQIVGKEEIYSNGFGAIKQIIQDEGIAGFYGGFTARLIAEIFNIVFTSVVTYSVNKYVLTPAHSSLKEYTGPLAAFLSGNYSYRFQVISTIMSTTNSKLAVANKHSSLLKCFGYLQSHGELNRGGALIIRQVPRQLL